MRPLFRTLLFFPLRYFRRNSPCSVFLCTFCSKCFHFHCRGASLFLHLHFVDDFWVTQGRTASNNKNNNSRRRTDWLSDYGCKIILTFFYSLLLLLFWGCAKFAEAGLMNEKPATTITQTAAAAATTAERHKAKKNVSYRVALVWSVQKNHNEKNSYFCSTLNRTALSTPQSQCGGFFAVPLFTVALCSFSCCCCCCFFKFTSSLLALLLL